MKLEVVYCIIIRHLFCVYLSQRLVRCLLLFYLCSVFDTCGGFLRLLLISVYYSFVVSVYIVLSICQVFALPFCCFLFGII